MTALTNAECQARHRRRGVTVSVTLRSALAIDALKELTPEYGSQREAIEAGLRLLAAHNRFWR